MLFSDAFMTDIVNGEHGYTGDKLALGAKPNNRGKWMPVSSIDPAVLLIDRCIQLLKPGGRLLIVLPTAFSAIRGTATSSPASSSFMAAGAWAKAV